MSVIENRGEWLVNFSALIRLAVGLGQQPIRYEPTHWLANGRLQNNLPLKKLMNNINTVAFITIRV